MKYSYREVDGWTLSDDEIVELSRFRHAMDAEIFPDQIATPAETAVAEYRAYPRRFRRILLSARESGTGDLAGIVWLNLDPEHDDNPDVFEAGVEVAAGHRRRGVGTALLERFAELARRDGRSRIISWAIPVPGTREFAAAHAAVPKSNTHINRLLVSDVDRDELERWVKEGPDRAAGYEVIWWDGPVPDEHLDAFADLVLVMNSAPRDDLEVNDFTVTPGEIRDYEVIMDAAGSDQWTIVARRISDGAFAGFHRIGWVRHDPAVGWVEDTGVRPEHRGHALGKWLKAAMMLRLMDERPVVREIRTGNADSNDAMLGINRAMGYRPMHAACVYEYLLQ